MEVEGHLVIGKKLYAAFMDLEKEFDKADKKAPWSTMKIYSVVGQLLEGIKV